MAQVRGFRISDEQRHKLHQLAETLGISPNATVGQLIDYAAIEPVQKMTAVSKLPTKANGHSDSLLTANATAIHA